MEYKEFAQRWVKNLMESVDAHLDEEARAELMEDCGRACARAGPARVARDCQGDLDQWLNILARWQGGEEYVRRVSQAREPKVSIRDSTVRGLCKEGIKVKEKTSYTIKLDSRFGFLEASSR